MDRPQPKIGDLVSFVNGGTSVAATVKAVGDDGQLDLEYFGGPDYRAAVVARSVGFCPDGGSHGWQIATEPAAAA